MATKDPAAPETPDAEAPVVEEAQIVEAPAAEESVTEVPASEERDTVVVDALVSQPAAREVIVVDAPVPPRVKGNRGLGLGLALVATVVYLVLLAAVSFLVPAAGGGSLLDPRFYYPGLLFFIGLVLVALVLNRAGWWSHIIGSVVVGAIVWLGSASLVLVSEGMLSMTQTEANETFYTALFSPMLVIAALLAREIAIWTGAILARRGRRLKVVNAEAYAAYEREQAELIPTA